MKKVTFITTGQASTNPRLVKEVTTLIELGFEVKVICCFYELWADKFDQEIFEKYPGVYFQCGGDPNYNKIKYYKTRLRQKLSQLLFKTIKIFAIPENAISRAHYESYKLAKGLKSDIYIAHNLGALPAAVLAAKFNLAKVGYDAEDMHSGQFFEEDDHMFLLNKYIEETYFEKTNYFTAASPLIADIYKKLYPYLNPIVVNNTFPRTNLSFKVLHLNSPLRLFWFSQTVGANRGIEEAVVAIGQINANIELHLLGQCSIEFKSYLKALALKNGSDTTKIYFHNPISPNNLFGFASQFDIGLATEIGKPVNRDICLTNKIFTYIQCGLAVVASDTQAQTVFINDYPKTGKLYDKNDAASLAKCLMEYIENPELLKKTRFSNYQLGQTVLNWETESSVFVSAVEQTLKNNSAHFDNKK